MPLFIQLSEKAVFEIIFQWANARRNSAEAVNDDGGGHHGSSEVCGSDDDQVTRTESLQREAIAEELHGEIEMVLSSVR